MSKKELFVDLSMRLALEGFKYLGVTDLGEVSGFCQECGHTIRYEHEYLLESDGNTYVIGSECQFKIYLLLYFKDKVPSEDYADDQLLRAGKWLWVIHRDNYKNVEIPDPREFDSYKELADYLRRVMSKEIARRRAKEKQKNEMKEFLELNNIKDSVLTGADSNFLKTAIKYHKNNWKLSDKQQKWLYDIVKRSNPDNTVSKPKDVIRPSKMDNKMELLSKIYEDNMAMLNLNDWEAGFVGSVLKQYEDGRFMSEKQMNIIEKIIGKTGIEDKNDEISVAENQKNKITNETIIIEDLGDIIVEDVDDISDDVDDISDDEEFVSIKSDYVGKKIKAWVIEKKTGIFSSAEIIAVGKETDKGVLCKFKPENITEEIFVDWFPKSQCYDDILL